MDLISFDVWAINQLNYEERIEDFRTEAAQNMADAATARQDYA